MLNAKDNLGYKVLLSLVCQQRPSSSPVKAVASRDLWIGIRVFGLSLGFWIKLRVSSHGSKDLGLSISDSPDKRPTIATF